MQFESNHRRVLPDWLGAALTGGLVLLFCGVLLWRDPLLFWNDDYELSILPVFADVARSWSEGHLPLLSPYSWVCGNLAGEYQYGTFSIFINAVVVLIWKLPLAFSQQAAALSMAHLFVLAMGGYLLARGRNVAPQLSAVVGVVAALNGWMICWGATDWFGALGAFAWLPWAWWGLERATDPARGRWRWIWPAPFVYLLLAGGFPYTVVMLALLSAWLLARIWLQERKLSALGPILLGLTLGAGLAAPAWLALFDYVRGSAREVQESAAHFQWVVPPAALPAFFLPAWTVKWADFSTRLMPHTATEMASGLFAPVALLFGLLTQTKLVVRRLCWELVLLGLVLLIAMLPSANVFRWSFRWLPFFHLVLALCAVETVQLLRASTPQGRRIISPGALGLALTSCLAILMLALGIGGKYAWPFTLLALIISALWFGADFFAPLANWRPLAVTLAMLLATYLCLPPNCGVPKYQLDQRLVRPEPLATDRLYVSIHPAPEQAYRAEKMPEPFGLVVRPGSTSMWGGVRFINGYSPIRPSGVARAWNFAIHGEIEYAAAERLLNQEAGEKGELARVGVDGLIVAPAMYLEPQPANEWETVYSSPEGKVYHRRGGPLPTVRVTGESSGAVVKVKQDSRQRVVADVHVPAGSAPAQVTFSRPFFPGYVAHLGAQPLVVTAAFGAIPQVEIPAGSDGELVLAYRPWWLVWGGVIAGLSALLWLGGIAGARRHAARS